MKQPTVSFFAAAVITLATTPASLLAHATPQMAEAIAEYRIDQAIEELHLVNGPYGEQERRTMPETVERWRPMAEQYFPAEWVDWALQIVDCESGGDRHARNRRSSAAGLFQFLRGTWDRVASKTGSPTYAQGGPFSAAWSMRNAAWLLDNGGTSHWQCKARRWVP